MKAGKLVTIVVVLNALFVAGCAGGMMGKKSSDNVEDAQAPAEDVSEAQ